MCRLYDVKLLVYYIPDIERYVTQVNQTIGQSKLLERDTTKFIQTIGPNQQFERIYINYLQLLDFSTGSTIILL